LFFATFLLKSDSSRISFVSAAHLMSLPARPISSESFFPSSEAFSNETLSISRIDVGGDLIRIFELQSILKGLTEQSLESAVGRIIALFSSEI
jgi:hypothetical protein